MWSAQPTYTCPFQQTIYRQTYAKTWKMAKLTCCLIVLHIVNKHAITGQKTSYRFHSMYIYIYLFIYALFNDVRISNYTQANDRTNNELGRTWKEGVVAGISSVGLTHTLKPQKGQPVLRPRSEAGPYPVRSLVAKHAVASNFVYCRQ
jgi:hypothetical protein